MNLRVHPSTVLIYDQIQIVELHVFLVCMYVPMLLIIKKWLWSEFIVRWLQNESLELKAQSLKRETTTKTKVGNLYLVYIILLSNYGGRRQKKWLQNKVIRGVLKK